jgi:hypothetical protein
VSGAIIFRRFAQCMVCAAQGVRTLVGHSSLMCPTHQAEAEREYLAPQQSGAQGEAGTKADSGEGP